MTEPSTTQRDELAAILINHDTSRGHFFGSPGLYESRADAILAKYILIPRPTMSDAQRGNSQVILVDGIAFADNAVWLRDQLDDEELEMRASARRIERIRAALAYLETEKAAMAESQLQERRDALTHALIMDGKVKHGEPWTYADTTPLVRRAVDRIIKLEDAAEAAK